MNWAKHAVDVIIDIVMNAITCESHNHAVFEAYKSGGPRPQTIRIINCKLPVATKW